MIPFDNYFEALIILKDLIERKNISKENEGERISKAANTIW